MGDIHGVLCSSNLFGLFVGQKVPGTNKTAYECPGDAHAVRRGQEVFLAAQSDNQGTSVPEDVTLLTLPNEGDNLSWFDFRRRRKEELCWV